MKNREDFALFFEQLDTGEIHELRMMATVRPNGMEPEQVSANFVIQPSWTDDVDEGRRYKTATVMEGEENEYLWKLSSTPPRSLILYRNWREYTDVVIQIE